ncbi:copper resistance CopC family protein [Herbidospora mongoliensis]|uniref:copper resistance CopC family protein n=1 Tax=Herbidospora mongoliensis TaxID=688067 RepID=UPI000A01C738|nr:copper resistance CopC family protein [Herbidospora mongoliensis]
MKALAATVVKMAAALTTVVAAIAAMALVLIAGAAPALAHDQLKGSDPAKDATVESLDSITLTFSAGVRFPAMVLHDAAGATIALTEPEVRGKDLVAGPVSPPPPGKYVIGWRVVSSDGHPIEGEIPFTLAGSATGPATDTADSPQAGSTPAATEPAAPKVNPQPVSATEEDSGGGFLWAGAALIVLLGLGLFLVRGRRTGG